jgi:hypothetical protein
LRYFIGHDATIASLVSHRAYSEGLAFARSEPKDNKTLAHAVVERFVEIHQLLESRARKHSVMGETENG